MKFYFAPATAVQKTSAEHALLLTMSATPKDGDSGVYNEE